MKDKHLREIVEIVGVVSIVAALLLVAWEIRESNRIAAAEIEMRLDRGVAELALRRAAGPEFAKLFPKLGAQGNHLVTATEESQIKGLARLLVSTYRSAQVAFDNKLLDADGLDAYRRELEQTLEQLPGLVPAMLKIQDANPEMRAMTVFQPLRDAAARRVPPAADGAGSGD